jgi:integrase/recombinase XerD
MTSLRQRMTEDMQVRNLALNTQTSYVQQVSLFARHFNNPRKQLGPEEIRSYQVYLTNERSWRPARSSSLSRRCDFSTKSLSKGLDVRRSHPCAQEASEVARVLSPEEVLRFLGCVGAAPNIAPF